MAIARSGRARHERCPATAARGRAAVRGIRGGVMVSRSESDGLGDAGDGLPVDELLLSPRGVAGGRGAEAVDFAEGAFGGVVERGERVVREEGAVAADRGEPVAHVLRRVLDRGWRDESGSGCA